MQHQIDHNELSFALDKGLKPIGWVPGAVDDETGKINPQVTKFYLGGDKFLSIFHVKPIYYETTTGHWRPLSEITSHQGNRKITLNNNWRNASSRYIDWLTKRQAILGHELLLPTPFGMLHMQELARPELHIGMTTTTVYPDPSIETTTVDGAVGMNSGSWTTSHNATTGTFADDSSVYIGANIGIGIYPGQYIDRGFMLFDTSSIGSDTIDSAVLSIADYGNTLSNQNTGADNIYFIVDSSPASNTALVTADFDQSGDAIDNPTRLSGTIAGTSISTGTSGTPVYNDFTLNATGEAAINGSGVSKFGMRIGYDDTAAKLAAYNNRWLPASAERSGTGGDPKLVVVHTASGGGTTFIPKVIFY